MKHHAKAASAESTQAGGNSRGLFRRAVATRGGSGNVDGSGASASRQLRATLAVLALVIAAFALTAAPAPAASPTVTCCTISDISYASAQLKGNLTTNGGSVSYTFEYSTDNADWQAGPAGFRLNGADGPVEAELPGLKGGREYFVRLSAHNFLGDPEAHSALPNPSFTTLTADPTSVLSIDPASEVAYTTATATGEIDRPVKSDDIACNFEYITDDQFNNNPSGQGFNGALQAPCDTGNPAETPGTIGATGHVPVSAKLSSLDPSTAYHLRLVVSNAANSDAKEAPSTFTTLTVDPPSVLATDAPTEISFFSAKASGEVKRPANADPAFDVNCGFEYVSDEQFTESGFVNAARTDCAENPITEASSDSEGKQVVSAVLSLKSGTTFHLRLAATNLGGTATKDAASTFTTPTVTPPSVAIDPPSDLGYTKVHLSGSIDPEGGTIDPTTSEPFPIFWSLQYARASEPGNWQLAEAGVIAGAEAEATDPIAVAANLTGLSFGTEYKFRLLATYADREAIAEGSFETEAIADPIVTLDPVASITGEGAKFTGTVDSGAPAGPLSPEGEALYETTWHLECAPNCPGLDAEGIVKSGEGAQPFSFEATGLEPNLLYEVKLIATNTAGSASAERTFQTSLVGPSVATLPGGSDGEGGYFLAATVNPHNAPVAGCHFVYGPNSAEDPDDYAFSVPCSPSAIVGRNEVQRVTVDIAQLGQYRLSYRGETTTDIAFNATAAEIEAALTALPSIGPSGVTVTPLLGLSGSGTIEFTGALAGRNVPQIQIEPGTDPIRNNPGTGCANGFCASYGTSPVRDGGNNSPVTVEGHVTGLTPGATYHSRLVVTTTATTVVSPDRIFIPTIAVKAPPCENEQLRKENNSLGLPECRAYEMVTYPNKEGNNAVLRDFDGGDALAYVSGAPNLVGSGEGLLGGISAENHYVAARTAAGWETLPGLNGPKGSMFAPPESIVERQPLGPALYSSDFRSSIWAAVQAGDEPLPVILRRVPDGSFARVGKQGPDPTGADFNIAQFVRETIVGASADLSHVVVDGGLNGYSTNWGPGIYEFTVTTNDLPRRVDLDNSGEPISSCVIPGSNGWLPVATVNAISADGRVVVVSPQGGCGGANPPANEVWARVEGTTSYDVSASQCNRTTPAEPCNGPANATYQGSAKDGSRIYFTTAQQLVDGDTDQTTDLYACDIPAGPRAPVGKANPCSALHEVSAGSAGKADVQRVLTVSDDGSTAYFTAKGILAANEDALGEAALPGDENLYVWRTDVAHPDGQTTFVARLPESGSPVAQTTPDGRYLLLQTAGRLVSSDTDDSTDIYRYDAVTGELARVSTNVSGAGGNGAFDARLGSVANFRSPPHNSHPAISDDGELIVFATEEALSPNDGNGAPDAYLWNDGHALGSVAPLLPAGRGGTTQDGQVAIDGSGQDIYVQTAAPLTATDIDTGADVYDVRVDGGFPQHQEGCTGETCQPSASRPPSAPASPANSPNGEGNIKPPKPCPKGKVRKHGKCVKKASKKHSGKKHHAKKNKRTASHGRGGNK